MISSSIKLLGIIGKPLAHSLSPALHNRWLKKYRLPFVYLPFELEPNQIKHLKTLMWLEDIWGLNVTAPYKQKVIPYLDQLDASAKKAGAVNTIVRRDRKLIGHNTDGLGWWEAMEGHTSFKAKGSTVVILGAGGAAKAIASTLKSRGAKKITLVRRPFQTKQLKKLFASADLLVQATPVSPKVPLASLPKKAWVMDVIYDPNPTPFLKAAKKLKLKTLGGLEMLKFQAALSFRLWTGHTVTQAHR